VFHYKTTLETNTKSIEVKGGTIMDRIMADIEFPRVKENLMYRYWKFVL